ncbi:MAG: DUF2511 domain-containing protein [Thioploca sp.]|nr:DUF2511 domain-containing protein [Thioploca sp.]
MNPNNQNYKSKVQFYTQKISERNEKQRLAAEQKKELEVQKDTGGMVSKSSFKGVWPLTVKEGTLACNNNAVTFKTMDGEIYAVNGVAESRGAQEINPIWKDNPDLPGAKLNISDLIRKGLSLCNQ